MAIGIHVVSVGYFSVNVNTNQVINKEDPATTINDVLHTEHQHRVVPITSIPSSANYPTVAAYLEAEAAGNYVLQFMSQTMIITYDQHAMNTV